MIRFIHFPDTFENVLLFMSEIFIIILGSRVLFIDIYYMNFFVQL
jgi:hypothetical protein